MCKIVLISSAERCLELAMPSLLHQAAECSSHRVWGATGLARVLLGRCTVLWGAHNTPFRLGAAKVGAPTPFSASLSFTVLQSGSKPGLIKFLAVKMQ